MIDVMDGITGEDADMALVYEQGEGGKFMGIFTESDYINVSLCWVCDL